MRIAALASRARKPDDGGVDRLEGGYQIEHYHSYTGGTVRAVIEVVQLDSTVAGTYRFERRDNGEVTWPDWPTHDGVVDGLATGEQRWQLSLAGTRCFARPAGDGRIGLARREDAQFFDDFLEPIQVAPAGEPHRNLAGMLRSMIDSGSREYVRYIAAALAEHAVMRAALPDAVQLVDGAPIDLRALLDATMREAAREERVYFEAMRAVRTPPIDPATCDHPDLISLRELARCTRCGAYV